MNSLEERLRPFMARPETDIESMIRSFGIDLDMTASLHPDIVGQIAKLGERYKISVQGSDHINRKRFTAAHELGHFLYHRDLLGDGVDDDKMYRSKNVGQFFNRSIKPRHETEANNFAAQILMPQRHVRSEHMRHHGQLRDIARAFAVSPAAMRIRLDSLGLPVHE